MRTPHQRPDRPHPGPHAGEIPPGQERALLRRHALEAQQRAFREGEAGRTGPSPADLAPIWRRAAGERPARP